MAVGARTCTIVFTDLVGSTSLRQRLGDEAFDVRRRVHDRLLTEAIERGGGEVVKHEGDGVMAVFASAADAITSVAAMQAAVTRELGDPEARFAMRIGVSAGDVAEEHGDFHGTPVVEAARLCAAASGGQILISDVVRVLAGSRCSCPLSSAGALELKGLDEPVLAWQVRMGTVATPRARGCGAAAACRDRRTGSLCRARPSARSTAHRVEERGDELENAGWCWLRASPGSARRASPRRWRPRSRRTARVCCTGGVTTGWGSRTRPGCTRSAASCRAPTTRRSPRSRHWRRISCGASRSSASACPMSCRDRRRMRPLIGRGCSTRSTRCSHRSRATAHCCWCSTTSIGPIRRRSDCSGGS